MLEFKVTWLLSNAKWPTVELPDKIQLVWLVNITRLFAEPLMLWLNIVLFKFNSACSERITLPFKFAAFTNALEWSFKRNAPFCVALLASWYWAWFATETSPLKVALFTNALASLPNINDPVCTAPSIKRYWLCWLDAVLPLSFAPTTVAWAVSLKVKLPFWVALLASWYCAWFATETSPISVALSTRAVPLSLKRKAPVWVAPWIRLYWLFAVNSTFPTISARPWTDNVALSDTLKLPLILLRSMLEKTLSDKVWLAHLVNPVQSERAQMKFACLSVTPNVALALLLNCQSPFIAETFLETTALPPLIMYFSALKVRLSQSSSITTSPCGRPMSAGLFKWL